MSLSDDLLFMLWKAKLRFHCSKGVQYWVAETPHERIFVDDETYSRVLKEKLAEQGIEMKTWSDYMKPAEEAWKRQCAIVDQLKSNVEFWKQVPGVQVRALKGDRKE